MLEQRSWFQLVNMWSLSPYHHVYLQANKQCDTCVCFFFVTAGERVPGAAVQRHRAKLGEEHRQQVHGKPSHRGRCRQEREYAPSLRCSREHNLQILPFKGLTLKYVFLGDIWMQTTSQHCCTRAKR